MLEQCSQAHDINYKNKKGRFWGGGRGLGIFLTHNIFWLPLFIESSENISKHIIGFVC